MKCRFLSISDEAYRDGTPAPVFLCTWASRLPVMPGWLDKMAGGGILIDHKKECLSCPCYSEQGHCEAPIPTQEPKP